MGQDIAGLRRCGGHSGKLASCLRTSTICVMGLCVFLGCVLANASEIDMIPYINLKKIPKIRITPRATRTELEEEGIPLKKKKYQETGMMNKCEKEIIGS